MRIAADNETARDLVGIGSPLIIVLSDPEPGLAQGWPMMAITFTQRTVPTLQFWRAEGGSLAHGATIFRWRSAGLGLMMKMRTG